MSCEINSDPQEMQSDRDCVCPYCDYRYSGSDATDGQREGADEEMVCDECGGTFKFWYERSITYHTSPVLEPHAKTDGPEDDEVEP